MAGENPTTTEYIQHHLQNLTYGKLPEGYTRYDGTVLTEATWTMAHGGADIWIRTCLSLIEPNSHLLGEFLP